MVAFGVRIMMFNVTFNNISVISWRSVFFYYGDEIYEQEIVVVICEVHLLRPHWQL
jgi:hypothetical protein